ncbi:MAG TPA: hypothetical protein DCM87_10695 [Planctomycetes bacterium]|nr:hypothetical protein [Planctomycetota bacterium]
MELLSSGDRMRWAPVRVQEYVGATHYDTTYNYTSFHAEDALAVKDVRVDHPIVSSGNNGSGATVSEYSWHNKFGLPVWTKDGNGRVGYTEYDAVYDAGAGNAVTWLARAVVEDIDTVSPPPGVTPGTPPSGFESSGADRINALTETTADGLCRAVAVTSPGGQTGHLVYAKLAGAAEKLSADVSIVIAYPHVENGVPLGEVAITGMTPGGKTCLSAKAFLPGDPGGAEDFFYNKDWRWGNEPAEIHDIFLGAGGVTGHLLERREVERFYDGGDGHLIAKERAWPDPCQPLSYYDANYVKYTRTTHYNAEGLPARIEGRETETAGGLTGFRQSEWRTYDPLGRPSTVAIGAGDADKVIVSRSYYDGGEGETGTTLKVGDGHLTLQAGYLGDAADGENEAGMTARKAKRVYNWRGFQTETWEGYDAAAGTALRVSRFEFDNQGRETLAERFVTDTSAANLRGKTATVYDERGRKCRTVEYGVDQGTGAVQANTLTTGVWYDPAGNVLKVKRPDGTFRKSSYDGVNRVAAEYLSYQISEADTDYAGAGNVTGDTVVEQTERGYDAAANLIKVVTYLRNHDATATGALTASVARREYRWFWHDALGRIKTEGFYGTNGGVEMTVRPAEPSSTGATVLVRTHAYSSDVSAVERWQATTAVDGRIEGAAMDAFGRARRQWVKSRSSSDHKITDFTRDAPGHVIARTVYQETLSSTSTPPAGTPSGPSTTAYDWGLMRAYSDGNWSENHISSTDLLRQVHRPDPTSGSPVSDSARVFAYNALGEARALWTRRGASATVGREAVYDPLGRKTSEVVRDDYEAGSNALEWDYDLFDRITAARSLDGATPAAVLNEVTTSFGPYGETVAVRQEHDGSVSVSTSPFATAVYTGPGTAYGLRRPTNQYFNKTSGYATAAEAEIAYDYGTAGAIDDMLTRPVRQRYFQYPYAAASEFRVDEYYMGARAWVRSESRQGAPSFALKLTQEIPSYQSVSGGLDRFGRTVLFKAWCNVKTWPLRRTWEYDATTGLLTAKRDYMKKTTGPEFALAAWVNTYDDFSRAKDVDYDYAQDTGPSWQWVDQTLDDAHWLYDGADGITHFSGDGATAYPSRTLNRREEIATIDNTPAVVLYTEAGEVRYQDYPLHGVADKYYFFDAWGRMCGHGTAIDPNDPPDPEMELDVYVTYDALGRVIVRTEVENEVPIPLHYYYDLQGNRAWEGPDAETVARVHFHRLYSGRNFALMGSAYYVVDPGDGAAMLCNSDGSFKQVLSTYPTGEPHPITVYGAQEVEALLAGGDLWDSGGRILGGEAGDWYSGPLGVTMGGVWAAEDPPEKKSPDSEKGVPEETQPPKKKTPKNAPKTVPPKKKKVESPEDRAIDIPGDGSSLNEDALARLVVEITGDAAPGGTKPLIEAIKEIGQLLPKQDADDRCNTCCQKMCGHDPAKVIGKAPVKCKGGPRTEEAKTAGKSHRCYCDKYGKVWAETRSAGVFLGCRCGGFGRGPGANGARAAFVAMELYGIVDRIEEKDENGKTTVRVRVIYMPQPEEKK